MAVSTIGIAAFFGAMALLLLVAQSYFLERREVFRGLRNVRAIEVAPTDFRASQLAAPLRRRLVIPGIKRIGALGKRLTPLSAIERLNRQLVYAGSPTGWDAERVLSFKFVLAGVLSLPQLLLYFFVGGLTLRRLLIVAIFGAIGYFIPDLVLRSKGAKRQGLIRTELPDSLDLLSITVEAGLGFDAAVARVGGQISGPLGQELHRMIQEMQLGKSRSEALRDLADRSNVSELKSFVLAMVQADIFGISIAKVLHVQAREMRIKRRQRAEERAQKVPVKIVIPLLLCIFPALFIVLMGPAAIRIWQTLF